MRGTISSAIVFAGRFQASFRGFGTVLQDIKAIDLPLANRQAAAPGSSSWNGFSIGRRPFSP